MIHRILCFHVHQFREKGLHEDFFFRSRFFLLLLSADSALFRGQHRNAVEQLLLRGTFSSCPVQKKAEGILKGN